MKTFSILFEAIIGVSPLAFTTSAPNKEAALTAFRLNSGHNVKVFAVVEIPKKAPKHSNRLIF